MRANEQAAKTRGSKLWLTQLYERPMSIEAQAIRCSLEQRWCHRDTMDVHMTKHASMISWAEGAAQSEGVCTLVFGSL